MSNFDFKKQIDKNQIDIRKLFNNKTEFIRHIYNEYVDKLIKDNTIYNFNNTIEYLNKVHQYEDNIEAVYDTINIIQDLKYIKDYLLDKLEVGYSELIKEYSDYSLKLSYEYRDGVNRQLSLIINKNKK